MIAWLHIAQIEGGIIKELFNYGIAGIVIGYFMWRDKSIGPKLETLSHRIDGLMRAMLIDVMSRDSSGEQARRFAQEMMAKIEQRDASERERRSR